MILFLLSNEIFILFYFSFGGFQSPELRRKNKIKCQHGQISISDFHYGSQKDRKMMI
jgi:hypothetical protein